MKRLLYHQTLERVIPVEVTDEQWEALNLGGGLTEEQLAAMGEARQFVVDTAVSKQDEYPLEFSMATVMTEDDEEVFDL